MATKRTIRVMGQFEAGSRKPEKPKYCRNCGRPVRETVGDSGYCKKCIALARGLNKEANNGL